MGFLYTFVLCLLLFAGAPLQARPVLRLKDKLAFPGGGQILRHKQLEGGRKLLLIGTHAIQLLDTASAKILESLSVKIPEPIGADDWVVSPDGRKMLLLGNYDFEAKARQRASIWDLQTGKQIAVLDRPILTGVWSKNGRTLLTCDDENLPGGPANLQRHDLLASFKKYEAEITFWDGNTFERRGSLSARNVTWWYLADDGEKFFFSSGTPKSFLGLKYLAFKGNAINIWDISAGRIEQTILTTGDYYLSSTKKMTVSPDGRFLAFVQKHRSKSAKSKLSVWDIGEGKLKYETNDPRISSSSLTFSPDGKYLALDAGSDVHIYETLTGQMRFALRHADPPDLWLDGNLIIVNDDIDEMKAIAVADGKKLYEQELIWETTSVSTGMFRTDSSGNITTDTESVTVDSTRIVAHPGGKIFMTYSNQYLSVFDARTGQLLQQLIGPPIIGGGKKPKVSRDPLVWKADWSDDGRTLYAISADQKSVSLWELLEG